LPQIPTKYGRSLVSQSWTAGGREAKMYWRRQQPARQHPEGANSTEERDFTMIEHRACRYSA
jgi:hypothetical protein